MKPKRNQFVYVFKSRFNVRAWAVVSISNSPGWNLDILATYNTWHEAIAEANRRTAKTNRTARLLQSPSVFEAQTFMRDGWVR